MNATDPKGFLGALNQSFTVTEVEGHIESKWTPRTYAVQTDLAGGITGAQASLYSRAKDALISAFLYWMVSILWTPKPILNT